MLSENTKAALYLVQYYGGNMSMGETIVQIFSESEIEETLQLLERDNIIKKIKEEDERVIENFELVRSLETFSLLDILNATNGVISFNSAKIDDFYGSTATGLGKWILDKREAMSTPHINLLRTLYRELQEYKHKPMTDHTLRMIRELQRDLDLARKYQPPVIPEKGKTREYTVFYGEYDIFDNLEVVGEDYIWQMKRESPDHIWRTAFLNQRLFKISNGFYSALDENVHFYIPSDNGRLKNLGANWSQLKSCGCLGDGDLDFSKELHIAFDANASICTAVVAQKDGNVMRVLKSFYVKTPSKLKDLVKMVADYYRPKLNHDIVVYYDHTFVWETANSNESYASAIENTLIENNYSVEMVYVGQAPKHEWKHLQIDRTLKGEPDFLWIQINLHQNEFLKIAMEQTGVRQGKNGFEKNKNPESTDDTPDNPDQYKTHVTDAFDTLWYGMNFFFTDVNASAGGGVYFLKK